MMRIGLTIPSIYERLDDKHIIRLVERHKLDTSRHTYPLDVASIGYVSLAKSCLGISRFKR